jgi:hypothetical protein
MDVIFLLHYGKQLAIVRGHTESDVVLMRSTQPWILVLRSDEGSIQKH